MPRALERPVAIAAPLASGVLLWCASPPVGVGWLAWVALVPAASVALALPGTRLGRLAVPLAYVVFLELLLVPAFPFGLARDQWGEPVVPILVGDSPVLAIALVVVPLAGLALYALRFPQPLGPVRPGTVAGALVATLVPALVWTALDLVRVKFEPGGFWGPVFLSQETTGLRGAAALAGPFLLTFVIVAFNYALALAVVGRPRLPALVPAGAAVGLTLVALLVGSTDGGGTSVRVAALQPGYDTAEFDLRVNRYLRRRSRDLERASLDLARDLGPLTREAAAAGARIVVWPEATIWVEPAENARVAAELTALAAETGTVLVVPYFLRGPDHGAAVAILPDETITRAQPKQRPMWFLGERGGNRRPPAPVQTGPALVGTLLGVDGQDPAWARRLAESGAALLAASTHDWSALADEQLAFSRIHAAALRVPIVRSDWRYGSAIVDRGGTVLASAGLEKRRVALVADVSLGSGPTPYARLGDLFGWLCLLGLVPLALLAARRRLDAERADAERPAQPLAGAEPAAHPPP